MKLLVVNADDLGYDPEIDRGILAAHRDGLVSSATVMVDSPFAAAALAAAPRSLGLGLHAVLDAAAGAKVAAGELRRQLARFVELRGAPPTHLDGHKHVHAAPGLLEAVAAVAREAGLPVRAIDAELRAALRAHGVLAADHFLGDAARRPAWDEERLVAALSSLEEGVTELMAHPGYPPSHARTSFGAEREIELRALCSPGARRALEAAGARLCDYAEVRGHLLRRPAAG